MRSHYNSKRLISLAAVMISAACTTAPGPGPNAGGNPDPGKLRSDVPTIEYKPSKYECVAEQPCTINPPTVAGDPTSFGIAPSLPHGMTFDEKLGTITGSPRMASPAITYTVTASNAQGKATTNLTITVHAAEVAPATLSYAQNPANHTIGVTITANHPTTTGGQPANYSVAPPLPPGLILDPITGIISGKPTMMGAASTYTVTASNAIGQATTELLIAIHDNQPSSVAYSSPSSVFTKGTTVTPITPTVIGGKATSFSVTPPLPDGLLLDQVTGVISGTPVQLIPATSFTVSASNSGGSAQVILSIEVRDVQPTNLKYTLSYAVYHHGRPIQDNIPSFTGGPPTQYAVSPALPEGLVLDEKTGIISGTPTHPKPEQKFIVTAKNTGGPASTLLSIEIKMYVEPKLVYAENSPSYKVSQEITPNKPTVSAEVTGTHATEFSIHPSLPAGLVLSDIDGTISGKPSVHSPKTAYTVTAKIGSDKAEATLELEVLDIEPKDLVYATAIADYRRDTEIPPNKPTHSGGKVTHYEIEPPLPAGLTLNTASGEISGTPTAATAEANYTVKAINGTGFAVATITITVKEREPAGLTYSANPATYNAGSVIPVNKASSTGGPINEYTVNPALPTGLTLDKTTGEISGTPQALSPKTAYTVTGTNHTGSTEVTLELEVSERIPGLYLDNVLLLSQAVSTTHADPVTLTSGQHTLEVQGTGDYTLTGTISGQGTLTISAGEKNTVFLKGKVDKTALTIRSGTLDLVSLKYEFGKTDREGTGILRRFAIPKDLSKDLRAWFDASNKGTIFRDASRKTPQNMLGGAVNGWTNLADESKSASSSSGLPTWNPDKASITLLNAAYTIGDLNLPEGGTVLAVVKSADFTGFSPAIFTGVKGPNGISMALGAQPLVINKQPMSISGAIFVAPSNEWVVADAQPIVKDMKQLFGMTLSSKSLELQIDGSTVSLNNMLPNILPQSTAYYIGRRGDDTNNFWNGDFFEIVVSAAAADLVGLTGYMAWHNNLQSSLPKEHKYAEGPPEVTIGEDNTITVNPSAHP